MRGTGAPQLQKNLLFNDYNQLQLAHGPVLRVMGKYQHLGAMIAQNLNFATELDACIAKASAAFRQMAKPLFFNKKMSTRIRLGLLEALVMPVLMFGSGSWTLMTPAQFRRVYHLILS